VKIQINSDNNLGGSETFNQQVELLVNNKLGRFSNRISRLEVHFSDENGQKNGVDDKRCLLEARIEGREPHAVSHQASTFEVALAGAAEKLSNSLETIFGRLQDRR